MPEGSKCQRCRQYAENAYRYYKNWTVHALSVFWRWIGITWRWLASGWEPERLTALSTFAIFLATATTVAVGWAQWNALKRADETTRESFTAVQRAFVTVVDVASETFHQKVPPAFMTGDLFWRFVPAIENSGSTPTKNMRWTTNATVGGPIDYFDKLGKRY